MDVTGYLALSRIDALTRGLEVTANNLANSSTDGFKEQRVLFSDYLSRQHGDHLVNGEKVLTYNQDRSTYMDTLQGELRQTGNPLDLAINGAGYFAVRTQQGIRLTRNGQFHRSEDGTLVDSSGNALLDDQRRPITLTPDDQVLPLGIGSDGIISTEKGDIARLGLATVDNPNTLHAEGNHLFSPANENDLRPVPTQEIRQGMLESSNVNAVEETTAMIKTQREYDLNFQLLQTEFTRRLNAIDKIATEVTT